MSNGLIGGGVVQYISLPRTTNLAYLDAEGIFKLKLPSQAKGIEYKYIGYEDTTGDQYCRPTVRSGWVGRWGSQMKRGGPGKGGGSGQKKGATFYVRLTITHFFSPYNMAIFLFADKGCALKFCMGLF